MEKARWALLKRPENLADNQTARLADLLKLNIQLVEAYLHREDFQRFWEFFQRGEIFCGPKKSPQISIPEKLPNKGSISLYPMRPGILRCRF
ncbi:MAG: transposase [Leptospirillum sp.]